MEISAKKMKKNLNLFYLKNQTEHEKFESVTLFLIILKMSYQKIKYKCSEIFEILLFENLA